MLTITLTCPQRARALEAIIKYNDVHSDGLSDFQMTHEFVSLMNARQVLIKLGGSVDDKGIAIHGVVPQGALTLTLTINETDILIRALEVDEDMINDRVFDTFPFNTILEDAEDTITLDRNDIEQARQEINGAIEELLQVKLLLAKFKAYHNVD